MNIRVFFIIITQFSQICTFIVSIKSLKERLTVYHTGTNLKVSSSVAKSAISHPRC